MGAAEDYRQVRLSRGAMGAAEDYRQVRLSHPCHLSHHRAAAGGGDCLYHVHHPCQAVKMGVGLQDLQDLHHVMDHKMDDSRVQVVLGSELVEVVEVEEVEIVELEHLPQQQHKVREQSESGTS